ncbi:hypothetical protein BFW01_g7939 [Lasiodiplodia theobromae]|nr:hypothetical protein BFW01_g7939 [Lasiodiplodia theobromae]
MLAEFVPPGQKRVNTPPGFSIDRVAAGKNAGFFFAGPSPENRKSAGRAPGARGTSTHHTTPSSGVWDSDAVLMSQGIAAEDEWNAPRRLTSDTPPVPGNDWFRAQLSHIMAEEPPKTNSDVDRQNPSFAWDVPEHLPGSPLCPLHPKHKGGGKGICVYHGRKKM